MKKIKILVVDDHKIIRDGISSLLHDQPEYSVIAEASNGREALAILAKTKIDIAIVDINMPEMNGIDCTREINEKFEDTRVIALTMHSEEIYLTKMIEAGAVGYILKNLGKKELLSALSAVVEGKHYYSPEITLAVIKELTNPRKKKEHDAKIELTAREMEVLELIVREYSNQEIADKLSISMRTVDAHRRNLLEKTGVRNTAGLVKYSINNHLFEL
ncbi:MAG: response regulator transcription factor [Bacteroidetes bacterium]|nr:response regulator transcription factor [Bacteroidota bacterium]